VDNEGKQSNPLGRVEITIRMSDESLGWAISHLNESSSRLDS